MVFVGALSHTAPTDADAAGSRLDGPDPNAALISDRRVKQRPALQSGGGLRAPRVVEQILEQSAISQVEVNLYRSESLAPEELVADARPLLGRRADSFCASHHVDRAIGPQRGENSVRDAKRRTPVVSLLDRPGKAEGERPRLVGAQHVVDST